MVVSQFEFAPTNPHDMDGIADHVGGARLALGMAVLCHVH